MHRLVLLRDGDRLVAHKRPLLLRVILVRVQMRLLLFAAVHPLADDVLHLGRCDPLGDDLAQLDSLLVREHGALVCAHRLEHIGCIAPV